ncbi:MAG TPA: glycerol-3-phosphate 1-O-acyltransferase PlsY [Clostridia bacterium]|nr:glycerol-3-phosphate 1-O-acyltransferase PlsY [Clostridia bacterium]
MISMVDLVAIIILSYLIGSIPTSIIVGKTVKGIDIRNYGSGNAGGTNSFRVMGWKAGVLVVAVDIFKGFAAAEWISGLSFTGASQETGMLVPILAGAAAVLGHCFTIFAKFKGGKGIATSAGVLLALFPVALLVTAAAFAVVLTTSGYVSLSSLTAAVTFPVTMITLYLLSVDNIGPIALVFSFIIAAFIFYTHRSNIKRLIAGKENRFERVRVFAKKG